jgi:hypothetical protein
VQPRRNPLQPNVGEEAVESLSIGTVALPVMHRQ